MKRNLVVSAIVALMAVASFSSAPFGGVFNQKYSPKKDGNLSKSRCGLCHLKALPKLNPYGDAMAKAMAGEKKLSPEVLAKIENLDSDGDGVKNGAEFKADTLPGDKASK